MRVMEPMTLAEIDTAPFRAHETARFDASPDAVFALMVDPKTWLEWFPLMVRAAWIGEQTSGVDAEREVALRVFGRYRERMIAWEPGARFSFTMIGSTSPLVTRMGEDWRISRDGSGARLDWTVGGHPSGIGKLSTPILRGVLGRLFTRGGQNLKTLLRQRGTQTA